MSLDLVNSISAAVSALAVVMSLVFVGLQIRASTRAQRALSAWQSENAWAQFNFDVARDPQTAELLHRITGENENLEALQGAKLLQAHFMIRSLLQHAQSQYSLSRGEPVGKGLALPARVGGQIREASSRSSVAA